MWGKRASAECAIGASGQSATSIEKFGATLRDAPPPNNSARQERSTPSLATDIGDAEGASSSSPQHPTPHELTFALTFTRILSVLMRSPHYKHYSLSDVEWLVLPAVLTGQCAVLHANINGRQVPLAVTLWASVSEDVDKRLCECVTAPVKLRPDEWKSGEILWLIDAVGDVTAVRTLLTQVQDGIFKGRQPKTRKFESAPAS
jgi:hemolysin-activating ACP:hemolysin acyltransferase